MFYHVSFLKCFTVSPPEWFQRAIEAQVEERRRQKEQEEARRREEEEEEERRVALEREMLHKQYKLDSVREQPKVREQHASAQVLYTSLNYLYVLL